MSTWEEQHRGALAASEVGKCLHCAAARLVGRPKTRPYTPAQLRRMSVGVHFQRLEAMALREERRVFYAGRLVSLPGEAVPIRGFPDFVIRENGGLRVREVKYRSWGPLEPERQWRYQVGVYRLRYHGCPGEFAIYNLDDRAVVDAGEIPPELPLLLREWALALAGVLEGRYEPEELPHEPFWCRRSEWACPDCVGARRAETELTPLERERLGQFTELRAFYEGMRLRDREYEAARLAAQEIVAAHGGEVRCGGKVYRLRETRSVRVDTKAIPPEVRETLPASEVVSRTVVVEEEE
jgi:hypothetical protein